MQYKVENERLKRRERQDPRREWIITPPKREYKQQKHYLIDKALKKYEYDGIDPQTCSSKSLVLEKQTFQRKLDLYYGPRVKVRRMTGEDKRQRKQQLGWSMSLNRMKFVREALQRIYQIVGRKLKSLLFSYNKHRNRYQH